MSTDNPLSVLQGTFFFRIVDQAFTRSKYEYAIQYYSVLLVWYWFTRRLTLSLASSQAPSVFNTEKLREPGDEATLYPHPPIL